MKIGICDWGIGGLGFYNLLRAERPDVDVVYIGDQGVPGYGLFTRPALAVRLREVFRAFERLEVNRVVVACNAASTVVGDSQIPGVEALGMIEPTLASLERVLPTRIAVIGGGRTIRSGSYARPLRSRGWEVRQRVAQPLSRRIEDGEAFSPSTVRLLEQILAPLAGVERLVLACTHYVVLEPEVHRILPGVKIVDPASEVWNRYRTTLSPPTSGRGTTRFFTTGSAPAMEIQARAAFGVIAEVEELKI